MSACVSQPVSWLRLERYALGELDADAAAAVEGHVVDCPACRACLTRIERDDVALLPLPAAPRTHARAPWWRRWVPAGGAALVAAAAALLLIVWLSGDRDREPRGGAVKGEALAVELVREHAGTTAADPALFRDGDRFSVRITCPPGAGDVGLEVEQAGVVARPIAVPADFTCGNRVALPGAFRVTGTDPVQVCVVRGAERACVTIQPAGE